MGDEPAPVLGVADARAVVRAFRRMAAGQPPQRHPPTDPVHQVLLGVLRHRLVDRDRHVLALATALAMDQRGDDPGRHLLAGDVIGVPDLRRDRRRVVFEIGVGVVAAIHHRPAQGEVDEVRALEVLPRPVIAERRHARGDELREARVERHVVEPQHLVERAAARVQQDVGAAEQAEHLLAPRRRLEVEHDRFLVAVVVPEEQRAFQARLVFEERADPPCRVALGRLDLDHLGAEPGEQQPGIFGALVGDLDDAKPGQHSRPGIAHHLARPRGQRICRNPRLLRQHILLSNGSGLPRMR